MRRLGILGFILVLCAGVLAPAADAAVQAEYFSWNTTVPPGNPIAPSATTIHRTTRTESVPGGVFDYQFDANGGGPFPAVTNIGADTFAVRWRARINTPVAGTWTFWGASDDGIRVWIDQALVVNAWVDRGYTATAGTIALTAGLHDLTVEYYENGGGARASLEWQGPAGNNPARQFVPDANLILPLENGLTANYVTNSADPIATPTITRNDMIVNFDWSTFSPDNAISVENFVGRWRGRVQATGTGSFTFTTRTDDGYELWINGTRILNNIGVAQGPTDASASISLNVNERYTVDFRFREQGGGAFSQLRWNGPGTGGDVVIPEQFLFAAINAAPTDIVPSDTNIDENQPANTIVFTMTSTDPDNNVSAPAHQYALVAGAGSGDNGLFNINGNQLRANGPFNREAQSTYSVRIRSTDVSSVDPSPTYEEAITITINDLNETPTDITPSDTNIDENAGVNATVCTMSTTDPDIGQSFTYTLVAGTGSTHNGLFNFSGNVLRANNSFDYETQSVYSIRVRTTDNGTNPPNLTFDKVFTITVNDLNETPTDISLSSASINENAGANAVVGNLTTADPDNPLAGQEHNYTLVAGAGDTDNGLFNISGNQLRATNSLDFEAGATRSVRVRTMDDGLNPPNLTFEKVFVITVNNVNEAPTDIGLDNTDISENAGANAPVGTLVTVDPDNPGAGQTHTYTLVPGVGDTDNGEFNIAGGVLRATASLDFEAGATRSVRIRSTDNGVPPQFAERSFIITVNDVNEAPTAIVPSDTNVDENAGPNATVFTMSTTDPDNPGGGQTHLYELVSGAGDTDNGLFNILGNALRATASLNFEASPTRTVRIRTTDDGAPPLAFEQSFVITVNNVNDPPSDILLTSTSIDENAGANAAVGTLSSVDEDNPAAGQTHSYTLAAGAGSTDNALFTITGTTLRANNSLNFEAQSSFSIRIRSTDNGVPPQFFEKVFTITVNNVNETPTDIGLTNAAVNEDVAAGSLIGLLSSVDPDNPGAGQTHTYTLASGTGDTGNSRVQISGGNELRTAVTLNFEVEPSFTIRLRTTDNGVPPLFFEKVFTITVNNVNEAPTDISLSATAILSTTGANAFVATISTVDPDNPGAGQTHTYTLAAGAGSTDNGIFAIAGNELRTGPSFVANGQPSYAIRLRSTDNGVPPQFFEEAFVIVTSTDTVPPLITITGNAVVSVGCGEGYSDQGATAEDDVDGDITGDIVVSGDTIPVNTPPGTYFIHYDVQDSSTNAAERKTRTVTVRDDCPLSVTILGGSVVRLDLGDPHTIQSTTTGNIGSVSYQWYFDDGGAKTPEPIVGADGPSYSIASFAETDAGQYYVEVSDDVDTKTSQLVSLIIGGDLPAAGLIGLTALAAALAAAGIRRRK